jgi:hypothetical protein
MNLRYALYERTQSGYCWTWRAPGLPDALLDDFRYRITVPTDSNSIDAEQLRGGICTFDRVVGAVVEEHVVLYRFFDGGSDAGRPNRVVMLTAWTTPKQVAGMPGRYGVVALLRSRVFEYVSINARTVGINHPPFCDSLAADEECPKGGTGRMPAAALMEFIDQGLVDKDNNWHLGIRGDEHSLQRRPSADFERKEKERRSREQQRLAVESARDEPGAPDTQTAGMHWEHQGAARQGRIGSTTRRGAGGLMKSFTVVAGGLLCAVVTLAVMRSKWGAPAISPEAAEVLRLFKELPPDEQRLVARDIQAWCDQHQQRFEAPQGDTSRGLTPYTQQPSSIPPVQNTRRGTGPDAAVVPARDGSNAQGGFTKPSR